MRCPSDKQTRSLILLVFRHHGRLCNAVARLPGSFDVDVAELAHVEFLQEFATCAPGRFLLPSSYDDAFRHQNDFSYLFLFQQVNTLTSHVL